MWNGKRVSQVAGSYSSVAAMDEPVIDFLLSPSRYNGVKAGARIGDYCSPSLTPGAGACLRHLQQAFSAALEVLSLYGITSPLPSGELYVMFVVGDRCVVVKPRGRLALRACSPRASRFKSQSCSTGASSLSHPAPPWNLAAPFPTRLILVQRKEVQL